MNLELLKKNLSKLKITYSVVLKNGKNKTYFGSSFSNVLMLNKMKPSYLKYKDKIQTQLRFYGIRKYVYMQ